MPGTQIEIFVQQTFLPTEPSYQPCVIYVCLNIYTVTTSFFYSVTKPAQSVIRVSREGVRIKKEKTVRQYQSTTPTSAEESLLFPKQLLYHSKCQHVGFPSFFLQSLLCWRKVRSHLRLISTAAFFFFQPSNSIGVVEMLSHSTLQPPITRHTTFCCTIYKARKDCPLHRGHIAPASPT